MSYGGSHLGNRHIFVSVGLNPEVRCLRCGVNRGQGQNNAKDLFHK